MIENVKYLNTNINKITIFDVRMKYIRITGSRKERSFLNCFLLLTGSFEGEKRRCIFRCRFETVPKMGTTIRNPILTGLEGEV